MTKHAFINYQICVKINTICKKTKQIRNKIKCYIFKCILNGVEQSAK